MREKGKMHVVELVQKGWGEDIGNNLNWSPTVPTGWGEGAPKQGQNGYCMMSNQDNVKSKNTFKSSTPFVRSRYTSPPKRNSSENKFEQSRNWNQDSQQHSTRQAPVRKPEEPLTKLHTRPELSKMEEMRLKRLEALAEREHTSDQEKEENEIQMPSFMMKQETKEKIWRPSGANAISPVKKRHYEASFEKKDRSPRRREKEFERKKFKRENSFESTSPWDQRSNGGRKEDDFTKNTSFISLDKSVKDWGSAPDSNPFESNFGGWGSSYDNSNNDNSARSIKQESTSFDRQNTQESLVSSGWGSNNSSTAYENPQKSDSFNSNNMKSTAIGWGELVDVNVKVEQVFIIKYCKLTCLILFRGDLAGWGTAQTDIKIESMAWEAQQTITESAYEQKQSFRERPRNKDRRESNDRREFNDRRESNDRRKSKQYSRSSSISHHQKNNDWEQNTTRFTSDNKSTMSWGEIPIKLEAVSGWGSTDALPDTFATTGWNNPSSYKPMAYESKANVAIKSPAKEKLPGVAGWGEEPIVKT
jgi:hypothetical protein